MPSIITTNFINMTVLEGLIISTTILKQLEDREVKAANTPWGDTQGYNAIIRGGIDAVEGDEQIFARYTWHDTDDSYTGLTVAGRARYAKVGESTFDSRFEGHSDLTIGCPSVAYHYVHRIGVSEEAMVNAVLDFYLSEIKRIKEFVEELERDQARRRKEYGAAINAEFRSRGADRTIVDAWWKMAWRREVTPEQFMEFVYQALADRERFSLALAARSGRDLEELEWKCRPSVPRTEAVLAAVAKATGIKPATEREYLAWKRRPKKWVFGA